MLLFIFLLYGVDPEAMVDRDTAKSLPQLVWLFMLLVRLQYII